MSLLSKRLGLAALAFALFLGACGPRLSSPAIKTPAGGETEKGQVFVQETSLEIMESYPIQAALAVRGDLPTPCDELAWEVGETDEQGRVPVSLFSRSTLQEDQGCIQVLAPFEVRIPLGAFEGGSYRVLLNGELVAEFQAP